MDKKEKISIIVPVYNQELYLDNCVASILSQSYSDFECILVDDGSTDSSPAMCDEYSAKDERIRVVHKENGGLTSARLSGFEVCTCDYVCFLDSDDYLHKDFLKLTIEKMLEENADVCTCGHFQDCNGKIIANTFNYPISIIEEDNIISGYVLPVIGKIYATGFLNYPGYVWGRLYRRSCISPRCFVSEREVYTEDDIFQMFLGGNIKKAAFIQDKLVYYRVNQNSLTHVYRKNMWSMLKKRHEYVEDFFKDDHSLDVAKRLWASSFYAVYVTLRNAYGLDKFWDFRREIKQMLSDELSRKALSTCQGELLRPRQKMMVFLLKFRMYYILYHTKSLLFK